MRSTTRPGTRTLAPVPSADILGLNAAALSLVDELVRLPSAEAALTAVGLLYGRDVTLPASFLDVVGAPPRISTASLLLSPVPLATLIPARLRASAAWRDETQAAKAARAVARARYRQLQGAFVNSADRVAPEAAASLVRYTYGANGRHWPWTDAAKRLLDRVTDMNRATLTFLAAIARGEADGDDPELARLSIIAANFQLPAPVLDVLAEASPPFAVPDFERVATAFGEARAGLAGEEATVRYALLFAEMLGLAAHPEVPS